MSDDQYTYNHDFVECPYCHYEDRDSWELGDGGEGCGTTECGHCEREFQWSRTFTINYKGSPLKEKTNL